MARTKADRGRKPKGWHPEDIKAAIRKSGMTLSRLSLVNGLHESCCRAALLRPQPEADKVISRYLGVPLHSLWPDRYDESGLRIRHVRDDHNQNFDRVHRLSDEVR